MLLSPLLANACYIHILKRKRERERKGEKETVKCQTPFIQIFKCIAMDLNPQLKLCYQCTLRSYVGILESNVFLSKGNMHYFYRTNYSVRRKMCVDQHTENKDSC